MYGRWSVKLLHKTLLTKLVNPGLGNKQSSHYLEMARNFIEANPVGTPGRYQVIQYSITCT